MRGPPRAMASRQRIRLIRDSLAYFDTFILFKKKYRKKTILFKKKYRKKTILFKKKYSKNTRII